MAQGKGATRQAYFLTDPNKYGRFKKMSRIVLTHPNPDATPVRNQSLVTSDIALFTNLTTMTICNNTLTGKSLRNICLCPTLSTVTVNNCAVPYLPGQMAKLERLEHLDVSFNEITFIPDAVCKLPKLKTLKARGNRVTTLKSIKSLKHSNMTVLDLSENFVETVAPKDNQSPTLRDLDLSSNRLRSFSMKASDWPELRSLSCSDNKMTSFTIMFRVRKAGEGKLSRLLLSSNRLIKIPNTVYDLRDLEILDISNNLIDLVPGNIRGLSKLSSLDVRRNRLKALTLDIFCMPNLTSLDLSHNMLVRANYDAQTGPGVQLSEALKSLDLSYNRFPDIPTIVILLRGLEKLDLSHNEITKSELELPENGPDKRKEGTKLKTLNLGGNKLQNLPLVWWSKLSQLTELDLSGNDISVIPPEVVNISQNCNVNLAGNPLQEPPYSVCRWGFSAISDFYKDLSEGEDTFCSLNVLVVGARDSGKTVLVHAIRRSEARFVSWVPQPTIGVEITDFELQMPDQNTEQMSEMDAFLGGLPASKCPCDKLNVRTWDFSGDPSYSGFYRFLPASTRLVLLVTDLSRFTPDSFAVNVESWFTNVSSLLRSPVVIPVATHLDVITGEDVIQSRCRTLLRLLMELTQRRALEIRTALSEAKVSLNIHGGELAREKVAELEGILKTQPVVYSSVFSVSAITGRGIEALKQIIRKCAINPKMVPEVTRTLPKSWLVVRDGIRKETMPVVNVQYFRESLLSLVPSGLIQSQVKVIASYFKETGDVVYFPDIPGMEDDVILRPSWLVEKLSAVIRHDMEKTLSWPLEGKKDCLRKLGVSKKDFFRMRREVSEKAWLDSRLVKCLWEEPPETYNRVLMTIIEQFSLGCKVVSMETVQLQDRTSSDVPDKATKARAFTQKEAVKVMFPFYLWNERPVELNQAWPKKCPLTSQEVSVTYRLQGSSTTGTFRSLIVRYRLIKPKVEFLHMWRDGAVFKREADNRAFTFLMTVESARETSGTLALSVRTGKSREALQAVWEVLLPLLMEVERLFAQLTGARVDRYSSCPRCRQPSFIGQWTHPEAARTSGGTVCSHCKDRVELGYLVPPRDVTSVTNPEDGRTAVVTELDEPKPHTSVNDSVTATQ
ncbi:MFHAS1 [Branchiostoma lanceolatum]|uniref:MFHAS1 protein n=1 Tax=Branchiostoma lanceolatum TaxID=7740 RepID=A0A8J9Z025_BRALA|nr:MFHAS1 [Branchiostoma lanceolatum]